MLWRRKKIRIVELQKQKEPKRTLVTAEGRPTEQSFRNLISLVQERKLNIMDDNKKVIHERLNIIMGKIEDGDKKIFKDINRYVDNGTYVTFECKYSLAYNRNVNATVTLYPTNGVYTVTYTE